MLEKSKIEGGEILETLAQRLRDEGKKIGYEEGEKAEKLKVARELIKRGVDKDIIAGTNRDGACKCVKDMENLSRCLTPLFF